MNLPSSVTGTGLYNKIKDHTVFHASIINLRTQASSLADTISKDLPSYTDHSIRHMDSLWGIADAVLTVSEIEQMKSSEVFMLACSFYLHDIGMAYGATPEGSSEIKSSAAYTSFMQRFKNLCSDTNQWDEIRPNLEKNAFSYAARQQHATAALKLACDPIPGTQEYLLEPKLIREAWGETIGSISASHNWTMDMLDQEIGKKGVVPLPEGSGDIGYVACLLRIIDYAHINRERARLLERLLRQEMPFESIQHWFAQEHIDGPHRDGSELVYKSAKKISDVDAWWLIYSMLTGLNEEIKKVDAYFDQTSRKSRFSLKSVRGASSPQSISTFIETDGFIPLEVNIRAGSIDRLVNILGGETLYGPNNLVPIRELLQNSQDALTLKKNLNISKADYATAESPIEIIINTESKPYFEIIDHGVGMSQKIMQDYLVTIASDYWNSELFYSDFPEAKNKGFRPAGKFGIGFISVFMIAESITVTSNRLLGERLQLSLKGLSRRGEIRRLEKISGSGTSIKLWLKKEVISDFANIENAIRMIAPMIENPIAITENGATRTILPNWWKMLSIEDFLERISNFSTNTSRMERNIFYLRKQVILHRNHWREEISKKSFLDIWPTKWPEWLDCDRRIVALPYGRGIILCAKGIKLDTLDVPGFVGIINIDTIQPDVSRSRVLNFDVEGLSKKIKDHVRSAVVENLDTLGKDSFVASDLNFLEECVNSYGEEVLRQAKVRWISSVKPPGDVVTLSCGELSKLLASCSSVRIALGSGPWTAMKKWTKLKRDPNVIEIVPNIKIDYISSISGDSLRGSLSDVWEKYEDSPMFLIIVKIIAECWCVDEGIIIKHLQCERHSDYLYGEISKDKLI